VNAAGASICRAPVTSSLSRLPAAIASRDGSLAWGWAAGLGLGGWIGAAGPGGWWRSEPRRDRANGERQPCAEQADGVHGD